MHYFINPHTGRKCKVGGATHAKLLRAQGGQAGNGIPAFLASLIVKPILGALFGKSKPTLRKGAKAVGLDYLLAPLIGKGYAGKGIKLAGQGPRRRRRAPKRRAYRGGLMMVKPAVMPYGRKPRRKYPIRAPRFAFI